MPEFRRTALFVPCYVDQLRPETGLATARVLERLGLEVDFPRDQTCCGQPLVNSGALDHARPVARRFVEIFGAYDAVVAPSASCVATVRHLYRWVLGPSPELDALAQRTFELCEFLTGALGLETWDGEYPHRVGVHRGCHGVRELSLATASERMETRHARVESLLGSLRGIELTALRRPDECCGFGGAFAVEEEAVSCLTGRDRLEDHERAGSEIVTSADLSCLLHLEGLIRRDGRALRVLHVAEVLAESAAS